MVFCLSTSYIVRCFGRKTLLIWGHIAIAVIHASVGIFNIFHVDAGVVAMVMCFMVAYSWSSGPVAWLYAAETVIDTALGVCLLTLWGTVFVLSIVCPILMDPDSLGPTGMFFIFSGLSCVGTAYVIFMIKETKPLTDKQKKLLFTPKEFLSDEDKALMREAELELFEEE